VWKIGVEGHLIRTQFGQHLTLALMFWLSIGGIKPAQEPIAPLDKSDVLVQESVNGAYCASDSLLFELARLRNRIWAV
jgi:hypothetical protein